MLARSTAAFATCTSYGEDEPDQTAANFQKLCNAYAAYGVRGGSILFASGDGGVAGGQSQSCTTFIPAFPSGCPFMTSVGAVSGIPPSETAASFSSGGFSRVFTQPSYQTTAVQTYLTALGSTNAGKFTPTGRAFPDVSAQGVDFDIVSGGVLEGVSGTSCSSPTFASVVGLINDRLIAAGKAPLGFLNPFLYANPKMFNDVTLGHNTGCNTNGFAARAGWDPVTLSPPFFRTPAFLIYTAGLGHTQLCEHARCCIGCVRVEQYLLRKWNKLFGLVSPFRPR
ncbi:peptidase S8/S53 domain-containing protein [Mycena amicta]|nr:peptidase S8/S53 domain-containing protein [Mycena amicta]